MNCDQAGGAVEPGALHLSGEVYMESEGSSPGAAALLSPASGWHQYDVTNISRLI